MFIGCLSKGSGQNMSCQDMIIIKYCESFVDLVLYELKVPGVCCFSVSISIHRCPLTERMEIS